MDLVVRVTATLPDGPDPEPRVHIEWNQPLPANQRPAGLLTCVAAAASAMSSQAIATGFPAFKVDIPTA